MQIMMYHQLVPLQSLIVLNDNLSRLICTQKAGVEAHHLALQLHVMLCVCVCVSSLSNYATNANNFRAR